MAKRFTTIAAFLALWAARHGLAAAATVAAGCVLWTITYAALLLWAMLTNAPLGGPLAYPGGLVAIALAAAFASIVLFLPATALAEWIGRRRRLPVLAQIPLTVALLAALCIPAAAGLYLLRGAAMSPAGIANVAAWSFGLSLIPVGLYWWVAQSGPLVLSVIRAVRSGRR